MTTVVTRVGVGLQTIILAQADGMNLLFAAQPARARIAWITYF